MPPDNKRNTPPAASDNSDVAISLHQNVNLAENRWDSCIITESRALDPGSRTQNPGSRSMDLRSLTQYPESWIQVLGSRIQEPGSNVLDTGFRILDTGSRMLDTGSRIPVSMNQWARQVEPLPRSISSIEQIYSQTPTSESPPPLRGMNNPVY